MEKRVAGHGFAGYATEISGTSGTCGPACELSLDEIEDAKNWFIKRRQ